MITTFIILALFAFAGWLIWPDLSREIDAMATRGHGRSTDCEIESAREALQPLRDMHRPFATNDPRSPYDVVCNHCLGPKKWPCPTALYLYSTEELQ